MEHDRTMSAEDIEALQLVRSAARVALAEGVIHEQFRERVQAAADRVTAMVRSASDGR